MTTRILETTQDDNDQKEDLNKLKDMLLKSNYPLKEMEKLIKQACEEFKSNKNINNNNNNSKTSNNINDKEEMQYSLSLPYVPGMEVLKENLKEFKNQIIFFLSIQITITFQSIIKNSIKICYLSNSLFLQTNLCWSNQSRYR